MAKQATENVPYATNSVVALATSTSEGGFQATVPTATTASTTSSGIITTLAIPTGTVITGPSTWNGKLTLPTVTTTYTLTANSGNTAAAVEAIEVGAGDIPLTLDQAVKLTFAAQVGKLIGWSQAGVFHQIIAVCDSTTTPTLASGSDCRVDVGSDLVVWTKHFSTFIAYTETAVPPSTPFGGGGGNGSPFLAYGGGSGGSGITTFPPSASGGNSQSAPTESGAAVVIPFASARPPGVSAAGPLTPETAAPPTAQGVESPPTPEATQPALNTQVAAVAAADFQGYAWLWVLGIGGLAIIGLWIYSRKSNTKL